MKVTFNTWRQIEVAAFLLISIYKNYKIQKNKIFYKIFQYDFNIIRLYLCRKNNYMPSHSEKQRKFFGLIRAIQKGNIPKNASSHVKNIANKISGKAAADFASNIAELQTKKEVLSILKEIRNPQCLQENSNPLAKQFTVKDNFETYVKRYLGQPLFPKELEALQNFDKSKPTKIDRTEIRFETTDDFNNTTSTIIKKMKDSGQFSFNAFTKHSKVEPKDEQPSDNGSAEIPQEPNQEPNQKTSNDDKDDIVISKSVLFNDEIKGAAILVEFLKKIDI